MANIVKLDFTASEINEKLGKVNDPVQTTGDSETAVMSQKAVTDYVQECSVPIIATRNLMTLKFENAIIVNGTFEVNNTGTTVASSPEYIAVKGGETYTLSWSKIPASSTMYIHEYEADKTYIKSTNKNMSASRTTPHSITVDAACAFVRIHFYAWTTNANWEDLVPVEFQMEFGNEATEYIPSRIIDPQIIDIDISEQIENIAVQTVQVAGDSETAVMSQKAVTDAISDVITEGIKVSTKTVYTTEAAENLNVAWVNIPENFSSFNGWSIPIRKEHFPNKTLGVTVRPVSNESEIKVSLELYDENKNLIKKLAEDTITLEPYKSDPLIYATEYTFNCEFCKNLIPTEVAYLRVCLPDSGTARLLLGYLKDNQTQKLNETDIDVTKTPLYYTTVNSSNWSRQTYLSNGEYKPSKQNIWLRIKGEDKEAFPYADYGLPVLELSGSTLFMTKDNSVSLAYKYEDRLGTCTLKWQGSSSLNYPKKNFTIKFDEKFEAKAGWGEQKKYCLKANFIDFSHSRNICGAKLWGGVVKSRTPENSTLNALVNAGAVDGFPICVVINGEYQGLYTFNIPKDGWMFGMGDGTQEAVLCADASAKGACSFDALATLDGDFDVEYAPDENDTDWIKTSFNRLIQACIDSDGTDLDTTISQYLDWESAIDYYIFCLILKHYDGITKNAIYATYDGVKWFLSAYDMDSTFGMNFDGKGFSTAKSHSVSDLASLHRLFKLIENYKSAELKARYNELINGALSEEKIVNTFINFAGEIPKALSDKEVKIWATLPSTSVNNVSQVIDFNRRRREYIDPQINAL